MKSYINKTLTRVIRSIDYRLSQLNHIVASDRKIANTSKLTRSIVLGDVEIQDNTSILSSKLSGDITVHENSVVKDSELLKRVVVGQDSVVEKSFIDGNISIGKDVKIFNVNIRGIVSVGQFSSLWGPNITLRSTESSPLDIGKFCSIARNVSIQTYNHNFNKITSYFIGQNLFKEAWDNELISKGNVVVKNDVWIGSDCVVLGGVTIGNGAIVAANSVVNHDVPDYAIVGGSPAKLIGYRFEDDVIKVLLNIEWWDWDIEKIKRNKQLFKSELTIDMLNDIKS